MLVAAFSVACGSKSKSIEDQAKEKCEKIIAAVEAGDFEKAEELDEAFDEWCDTLSDEDFDKADATYDSYDDKLYAAIEKGTKKYAKKACDNILKALEKGNLDKAEELVMDLAYWYEGLADEYQEIADEVLNRYEDRFNELAEDLSDDYYYEEDYYEEDYYEEDYEDYDDEDWDDEDYDDEDYDDEDWW